MNVIRTLFYLMAIGFQCGQILAEESTSTGWRAYLHLPLVEIRHAAEEGDPMAQYVIARVHEGSIEIKDFERDESRVEPLFREAATQGYNPARYDLGRLLLRKGETSTNEGITWLERAAIGGSEYARIELGDLYFEGILVDRDPVLAYAWASIAAKAGSDLGQQNQAVYGEELNDHELAAAVEHALRLRSLINAETDRDLMGQTQEPAQSDSGCQPVPANDPTP